MSKRKPKPEMMDSQKLMNLDYALKSLEEVDTLLFYVREAIARTGARCKARLDDIEITLNDLRLTIEARIERLQGDDE